jgi:hypothetical protein
VKGNDENGSWKVFKPSETDTIPMRLNVISSNQVFAGTYKIVFYGDESNKLLKMEIWSDNLYIVCRKGLFNYDGNG